MAVNGVELKIGQRWMTKEGIVGTIKDRGADYQGSYPWILVLENKEQLTYDNHGRFNIEYPDPVDLDHLIVSPKEYSITEITDAFKYLGWGGINVLFDRLQEVQDPEYTEYLRLKNKFEIKDKN